MKLKNDLADRSLSSKNWWGIVNSLSGGTGHSEIPAIEKSDTVYTTAKDKANIFCQIFAEKCRLEDGHLQLQEAAVHPQVLLDKVVFKPKDITKILRRLKPDKASGPDQVPSRVHYVSFNSASLKVLSRTNGRLPLSSQSTTEIPRLIQLSTSQLPC